MFVNKPRQVRYGGVTYTLLRGMGLRRVNGLVKGFYIRGMDTKKRSFYMAPFKRYGADAYSKCVERSREYTMAELKKFCFTPADARRDNRDNLVFTHSYGKRKTLAIVGWKMHEPSDDTIKSIYEFHIDRISSVIELLKKHGDLKNMDMVWTDVITEEELMGVIDPYKKPSPTAKLNRKYRLKENAMEIADFHRAEAIVAESKSYDFGLFSDVCRTMASVIESAAVNTFTAVIYCDGKGRVSIVTTCRKIDIDPASNRGKWDVWDKFHPTSDDVSRVTPTGVRFTENQLYGMCLTSMKAWCVIDVVPSGKMAVYSSIAHYMK